MWGRVILGWERLPSGRSLNPSGWAHSAGKTSLGNLEVGGKLPDACRVDLSFLKSNPVGTYLPVPKAKRRHVPMVLGHLAILVLISLALPSLASVSTLGWSDHVQGSPTASLDFMILYWMAHGRPREYPLGDFSLCIAFKYSSWSLLVALSLALSQVAYPLVSKNSKFLTSLMHVVEAHAWTFTCWVKSQEGNE